MHEPFQKPHTYTADFELKQHNLFGFTLERPGTTKKNVFFFFAWFYDSREVWFLVLSYCSKNRLSVG